MKTYTTPESVVCTDKNKRILHTKKYAYTCNIYENNG